MRFNRRDFGKLALATSVVPASSLFAAKVNSNFDGVQIGTITYSYRDRPELANDAHELLKMIVDSGVSAIELMPSAAERFAGAPLPAQQGGARGGRAGSGGRGGPGGAGFGPGGPGGARGGSGRGGGQGRGPMTPEQQAAAEKLKQWRLSASMDKFKEFRKLYNDAGVEIYCHKLTPSDGMSDAEFDYFFEIAKAMGAKQVSLELPEEPTPFTQRLGDTALKHGMVAAYHAHEQATETAWDAVLAQSKGNSVNLDCGHYYAGTGKSPVPAIIKYHERLSSLHLKDRTPTTPEGRGANLPWGQGSTPIADILQTMKKNKYKFPAAVELEYQIPAGSDSVTEVRKCVEFCRKALA
ncbi:MAG TPA: sugar phosphate isomerase/epimerase [Bryobacteraceae bacterium]|nr:sugar phosphate isomerase/epimerase [Bryobacteraceae bacterium]